MGDRKRLRLDYFANQDEYSTQHPPLWQNNDVLVHIGSFCDDARLGTLCCLSNYHRFVFSLDETWKHLPHRPDDAFGVISTQEFAYGFGDFCPMKWPPYAMHLPELTSVKYKRAYYVATKNGLRPSLEDSLHALKLRKNLMERDIQKTLDKQLRCKLDMQSLKDQIEVLGIPDHSIGICYYEQWYHDHTYYMRRLWYLRKMMAYYVERVHDMENLLNRLNLRYGFVATRWKKTQTFAKFLKMGVWSFYDLWDMEKTSNNGRAIMRYYKRDLSIQKKVEGRVDWRLDGFDNADETPTGVYLGGA